MQFIGRAKQHPDLLAKLTHLVEVLATQGEDMTQQLDDLTAQVKANNDLLVSAVTLINGIADRIAAAGTDGAQLAALTQELKDSDIALAAAISANTPSAPIPSASPAPTP